MNKALKRISEEIPKTEEGLKVYIKYAEKEEDEARLHHQRIKKLLQQARDCLEKIERRIM